jgi:hypothetical protein
MPTTLRSLPAVLTRVRPRVTLYRCGDQTGPVGHDLRGKTALAQSLAELLGYEFVGTYDAAHHPRHPLYVVPSDTLTSLDEARRLGVGGARDLFGGFVPRPFMATKVISHPLVRPRAAAPAGWVGALGAQLEGIVLPGYSVFTPPDALRAGERLLEHGPIRLKNAGGVGGAGQVVVSDRGALAAQIDRIDPTELAAQGWVVERNLDQVETYSVGQVEVGPWTLSYVGQQYTTRNPRGHRVYGGSTLLVTRGGFEALPALDLTDAERLAIDQAMRYHQAARRAFRGMFASRVNYDIAQGVDATGQARSGVLEQSWRIGGASGSEVAALHAFKADERLRTLRVSNREVYGNEAAVPAHAMVYYDDIDPDVGRLTKYAHIESHVHA